MIIKSYELVSRSPYHLYHDMTDSLNCLKLCPDEDPIGRTQHLGRVVPQSIQHFHVKDSEDAILGFQNCHYYLIYSQRNRHVHLDESESLPSRVQAHRYYFIYNLIDNIISIVFTLLKVYIYCKDKAN